MYIFEVSNKDDIKEIVVKNLRTFGIKHRIKKFNSVGNVQCGKGVGQSHVFKVPLASLSTDAVFLNCGAIIDIPCLVLDSCSRIRENIETEGIFRKAGSSMRQKEIKALLEAGKHLQPEHNVIDVANILKIFFRDLPEPLIPYTFHDIFLRCLILEGKQVDAVLQTCLLLPTLHLNVLAYLMEVLKDVSDHCAVNKMDAHNIALITTPSIMPVDHKLARICATRLECHVKVVELLIQHAEIIGMVPACARNFAVFTRHSSPYLSQSDNNLRLGKKKKRSGSLTRVLHGIKKMVGKGSPALDDDPMLGNAAESAASCVKSGKKRRAAELSRAFPSKKGRGALSPLPHNASVGSFPFSPTSSVARVVHFNPVGSAPSKVPCSRFADEVKNVTSMPADKEEAQVNQLKTERRKRNSIERFWDKLKRHSTSDVGVSTNTSKEKELRISTMSLNSTDEESCNMRVESHFNDGKTSSSNIEETEFVKIFKSEYEDIRNRVTAIESHIFQEFENMTTAVGNDRSESPIAQAPTPSISEGVTAESVQCEYEKTLGKSVKLENTSADHMARILGRELKIRHSLENKAIRSPSARKIGSLRRRSKESFKSEQTSDAGSYLSQHLFARQEATYSKPDAARLFYQRSSLRRGRPNTVLTGLPQCSATREVIATNSESSSDVDMLVDCEENDPESYQSPLSGKSLTKLEQLVHHSNEKNVDASARDGLGDLENWNEACRYFVGRNDEVETSHPTGRPSVVWLRNVNAGMVTARTKLFDGSNPASEYLSRNNMAHTRGKMQTPQSSKRCVKIMSSTCGSSKEPKFQSAVGFKTSPKKIGTPRRKTVRSTSSFVKDGAKCKRSPTKGGQLCATLKAGHCKENMDVAHCLYGTPPKQQNMGSVHCDDRRVLKQKSPLKDCNAIKLGHKDLLAREMPYIKKPLLVKSPSCYARTPQHRICSVRNHTPLKALTPLPYSPKHFAES